MANVLGVKADIIGLVEGIAEATASLLKMLSGWLSDRLQERKWLAVAGYAISAPAKPFRYIADSWSAVAGVRWADHVGKGIRTAPRDALVAASTDESHRGLAFGFHRAADTGGAMLGLISAVLEMVGVSLGTGLGMLTGLPMVLNELCLGVWLIVKAFSPSAIVSEPGKAGAT